jgi:acyl-CoA thioesterase FadM
MKIDYRSSAVHGEWLDVVLNHVEKTGRKTLVNGRVVCGDRILAEGSVLFVQVRGTQI